MFWRQTRSKAEIGGGWAQEGVEKIKASRHRQGRTPRRIMTRVGARKRERERGGLSAGRDVGARRDVRGGCTATHAPFARP